MDDFRKTCISYIGDIDGNDHEMQVGKLHTSFPPLPSFLENFEVMSELDAERAVAIYALRRTVMKDSAAAGFYAFMEDVWSGSSHVQEGAADVARRCLDHLEALGQELGWPGGTRGGSIVVEDDGAAMDPSEMAAVDRGRRWDETAPGARFGLAITRDLAAATGGGLHLSKGASGGLRATIEWGAN